MCGHIEPLTQWLKRKDGVTASSLVIHDMKGRAGRGGRTLKTAHESCSADRSDVVDVLFQGQSGAT